MEKELYDKIVAERNNEIAALNNKIKYVRSTCYFKSEERISISFKSFNCPLGHVIMIKDGSIDREKGM